MKIVNGFITLRVGAVVVCCEGNSLKGEKFRNQLSDCQFSRRLVLSEAINNFRDDFVNCYRSACSATCCVHSQISL